jgi:septum formation protein
LCSSSPRRLELLRQIGIEPAEIFAPNIDETPRKRESPRAHALRIATEKLASCQRDAFVIAADTVVAAGARIMPKAETGAETRKCLALLSGRRHRVYTAVAIRAPGGKQASRTVLSVVGFARLTPQQINAYLATGEWAQKAGGYAIQGAAATFINFLSGSYSGVVGLPLYETSALLTGLGYK